LHTCFHPPVVFCIPGPDILFSSLFSNILNAWSFSQRVCFLSHLHPLPVPSLCRFSVLIFHSPMFHSRPFNFSVVCTASQNNGGRCVLPYCTDCNWSLRKWLFPVMIHHVQ
jgi:hypothetical protein